MTLTPTTTPPKAGPRWRFTVEAVGPGAPAVCRVRRALKWLLRTHGLKCLEVAEVPQAAADVIEAAPVRRDGQTGPTTRAGGNVAGEGNGTGKGEVTK